MASGKVSINDEVLAHGDDLDETDTEELLIEGGDKEKRNLVEHSGILSKWTNYIHGWQDRYVVLKNGTLSYFKSENETEIGCRGAISLQHATVSAHPFDECRFDVSVGDSLWYLRAGNEDERHRWIEALELHKQQLQVDSAYGSEGNLKRHGSLLSITSTTSVSAQSISSFKHGRSLKEKLAELDTYRDILCKQIDTLQTYFDTCAQMTRGLSVGGTSGQMATSGMALNLSSIVDDPDGYTSCSEDTPRFAPAPVPAAAAAAPPTKRTPTHRRTHSSGQRPEASANAGGLCLSPGFNEDDLAAMLRQHGLHSIDFKGESYTFKATTAGILATLSYTIELMTQREDAWRKRVEKEVERRKRLEEAYRSLKNQFATLSQAQHASTSAGASNSAAHVNVAALLGSPDLEEGPHCVLKEEEFFDAVDALLEKRALEDEKQARRRLTNSICEHSGGRPRYVMQCTNHPLYSELTHVVDEHFRDADDRVWNASAAVDSEWQLFAQDGDMRMYRRELEENGRVIDPLKAVTKVSGVTGREMCMHFWDTRFRPDWEDTADGPPTIIERPSDDTLVIHQKYQRVWPSAQRDSVFWSHIRHSRAPTQPSEDDEAPDLWMVVNYSTAVESYGQQVPASNCVRVKLDVALLCKTIVRPPADGIRQSVTRDDITCYVQYTATVNPGGWVPAAALRTVYKREYPRFLKKFTKYVADDVRDKPIEF